MRLSHATGIHHYLLSPIFPLVPEMTSIFLRSEVVAAQVLGSLEMSLDSFLNLSMHLGTHISSSLPPLLPLPSFYGSMLEHFTKSVYSSVFSLSEAWQVILALIFL